MITDPGDSGPVPIIDAASLQHMHVFGFNLIPYLSTPTQIPRIRIIRPSDFRILGILDLRPIIANAHNVA